MNGVSYYPCRDIMFAPDGTVICSEPVPHLWDGRTLSATLLYVNWKPKEGQTRIAAQLRVRNADGSTQAKIAKEYPVAFSSAANYCKIDFSSVEQVDFDRLVGVWVEFGT